jgi:hypothetical protein
MTEPKPQPTVFSPETADFFTDLEAIRLSDKDSAGIGTREILTRVPVRKPRRGEFFRTHRDPAMSLAATTYVDSNEHDDVYFVAPAMRGALAEDLRPVCGGRRSERRLRVRGRPRRGSADEP